MLRLARESLNRIYGLTACVKTHRLDVPGFHLRAPFSPYPFHPPEFFLTGIWARDSLSCSGWGRESANPSVCCFSLPAFYSTGFHRSFIYSGFRFSGAKVRFAHDAYSTLDSVLSIGDYSVCTLLPKERSPRADVMCQASIRERNLPPPHCLCAAWRCANARSLSVPYILQMR